MVSTAKQQNEERRTKEPNMSRELTPAAAQMLQLIGFESEDDLENAHIANKENTSRIMVTSSIIIAMEDLRYAERHMIESLEQIKKTADSQVTAAKAGNMIDPAWVTHHAKSVAEHHANMTIQINKLKMLASIWKAMNS